MTLIMSAYKFQGNLQKGSILVATLFVIFSYHNISEEPHVPETTYGSDPNWGSDEPDEMIYDLSAIKKWNPISDKIPSHLDCPKIVDGDPNAIQKYKDGGRIIFSKEVDHLSMECRDIYLRVTSLSHIQHPSNLPIAIARNVFQDYYLQESFLGINWSPLNEYCFAMDQNSRKKFKKKMRTMAACFKNVVVLEKEFFFDSAGHYQDEAHWKCIKHLLKKKNWHYVLLLQNNDIIIKSNAELSQIIRAVKGTQVIGRQATFQMENRFHSEKVFNAKGLRLFKQEHGRSFTQLYSNITIVKSMNEAFLSRNFLAALDKKVNMDTLLVEFGDPESYGVDEFLFSTLVYAHHLGLPGQSSKICYQTDFGPVRFNEWTFDSINYLCRRDFRRHHLCMITVEYISELKYHHEITANKIRPSSDFGSVICVAEMLKERALTHGPMPGLIKYQYSTQVLEKLARRQGTFDAETLECNEF